ncbi:uroporphyrinogen-III C-methyltransferase [Leptospira ognonensis]|uniref:uroporphyrinogen-III C-methyltransferase n=1 Tax=Leptospira ognonensis TaxID=2484945 RepID=A0A4R9JYP8_9LEPT|nr:uroporphyrinogen-III C-methyltransferase [Leptospira ognonensis]TGL56637.1 uroporphyrinogen-III C-methyltransferase [Leptospira ognonensis]
MLSNKTEIGRVSFVSGGPGPVDLLTLRGLERIKNAEVILYDALLDPEFLDIFPESAICLYVGKRSGQHSRTQEEISELLLEYAKAGKHVVRLKGGDATVFGRLGEEIEILQENGISFEIIPGVSSVTAGVSALNSSLTLRGVSRQIIILDGHTIMEDNRSWVGMENFFGTIVILMGTQKIKELSLKLIAKGILPETPIALVENAGGRKVTSSFSTLNLASEKGIPKETNGPGILYVGEAIRKSLEVWNHDKKISNLSQSTK